jgi:hypothetical protein
MEWYLYLYTAQRGWQREKSEWSESERGREVKNEQKGVNRRRCFGVITKLCGKRNALVRMKSKMLNGSGIS